MKQTIQIGNRLIGPAHPCFIIAEAGVNHNGSLEHGSRLVNVAIQAGVDAVKFQTFKAARLASALAPKAQYQCARTGTEESQLQMLQRLELSPEGHRHLRAQAEEQGVLFLSSPFEEESADFLDQLGVAAFKIPSGEITNLPFLNHVARKRKPMIVSTGMSSLGEVEAAVQTIRATGNDQLVLLHCVSNYPAEPAEANLRVLHTLAMAFQVPIGFSDHTPGIEVALAARALGACVIEKHFTLDRRLPGPDQQASLEPEELASLVKAVRNVEAALGDGRKHSAASEGAIAAVARKSLVAAADIPVNAILREEDIAIRRPGTGLPPALRPYLVGRRTRTEIKAGIPIQWDMVA